MPLDLISASALSKFGTFNERDSIPSPLFSRVRAASPSGELGLTISMPDGAKLLTVQTQTGSPVLWALVNTKNANIIRAIVTVGTGNPMPYESIDNLQYIGTYQLHGGSFIGHVFEEVA